MALEELHNDVMDANQILSNDSNENDSNAQEQIRKIKDNLKYLEDNLINQAAEEAVKSNN